MCQVRVLGWFGLEVYWRASSMYLVGRSARYVFSLSVVGRIIFAGIPIATILSGISMFGGTTVPAAMRHDLPILVLDRRRAPMPMSEPAATEEPWIIAP